MPLIKFHGKALRFNGFTDGMVVPTGKYRESGQDLRDSAFSASTGVTKSDASKIGATHHESLSNPLNSIRGAFTIDAFIVPDYGGVIIDKPGAYRLKYGEAFEQGRLTFEVHTAKRPFSVSSPFNVNTHRSSHSGSYSGNEHKPQEFTKGKQGLVMVTAQYTQREMKCFVNGDLVCKLELGEENTFLAESSSDIFIGGQGGEFRGIIESVRISQGIVEPNVQPLTVTNSTFGLWTFDDEYHVPDVHFFDNARSSYTHQGRDGADTHDGLFDIPMLAMGHTFDKAAGTFKIRDYSNNPGSVTDHYTALEKLASLATGLTYEEIRSQTYYTTSGTLDLGDETYVNGIKSSPLNAIVNHSGTHPMTGISKTPSSASVVYASDSAATPTTATDLDPMQNQIERVRITKIDFLNSKIFCESILLANDAANGTADNLPTSQGFLHTHSNDTPIWFIVGKADLLIDPGTTELNSGVANQRERRAHTFTTAKFVQGQRFSDKSQYRNDAYLFAPKSRMAASTTSSLNASSSTYGYHTGVTSYSLVEGDFFLNYVAFDEQKVKQTVQGISNSFECVDDDVTLQSCFELNERVKVTESVFNGPVSRVINKTQTVGKAMSDSNAANRIVVESGIGFNTTSASTRDEIVAIAVSDVKPFMLKGLDTEHTADLVDSKPTNDAYIRHLTPSKKARIATITSPAALTSAGGPSEVLVFYDAIDLTGEVVAGTGLTSSDVNTKFSADHATGSEAYLVVRKTIPAGSAIYGTRTVSDYLRRPVTSTTVSDVLLDITAAGGIVSLPTTNFNDEPRSHTLRSSPTGDITPSPFINIEDTVLGVGTGIRGYGRPKGIPSTNTPDASANNDYHTIVITGSTNTNQTGHIDTKITPSSLRRANLQTYDIVDNELLGNENLVLIHPTNPTRNSTLDDFATLSNQPKDALNASVERNLMRGRVEEITPLTNDMGTPTVTLRGRSSLMDINDYRSESDFDLANGVPIKEIGDLGTPTVSLTLGGQGQGAIDIQPIYEQHPHFPGWKDKIVGSKNASVRNDKQTSTYYASTRSLVEIPIFPSMFYDVDKRIATSENRRVPLPSDRGFEMTVDCTMTASNRPQAREYESKFTVDWGHQNTVSSIEINQERINDIHAGYGNQGFLVLCQRPSVQAIITSIDIGNGRITLNQRDLFEKATGERGDSSSADDTVFYVTIGQGVGTYAETGLVCKASISSTAGCLDIDNDQIWNPLDLTESVTMSNFATNMTVVLGGYVDLVTFPSHILNAVRSPVGLQPAKCQFRVDNTSITLSDLQTAIGLLLGISGTSRFSIDPQNSNRLLIKDGPNMEAFLFDPNETYDSFNDRPNKLPIECMTSALSLKGKLSSGSALDYVRPQRIDFTDIANKRRDFPSALSEVVRIINMAGHPLAVNENGSSAYDPPSIFPITANDTKSGSHMGYVRAFLGDEVESRDGERGHSIVIHSTVPGAAGRNFAIWLKNRSPYPYRPVSAVGVGGLLTTNSRSYEPNSFPAPLPISYDGETFAPITTFQGAPHGKLLKKGSTTDYRTYNGIGRPMAFTTATAAPAAVGSGLGAATYTHPTITTYNSSGLSSDSDGTFIGDIAVSIDALDHNGRSFTDLNKQGNSVISINGRLATVKGLYAHNVAGGGSRGDPNTIGSNCAFLYKVYPYEDPNGFFEMLYDKNNNPNYGLPVEILDPIIDADGILFFGGGHTGTVFDISDGTNNDYSGDYKHNLAKGPTGFSGFQNLHEVSTASAVLDFTDITDNDTINANTLRGFHHQMDVNSDGDIMPLANLYVRMNDTISGSSFNQTLDITEDLYGSNLRLTATAAQSSVNGPAYSVDTTSKGLLLDSSTGYPTISPCILSTTPTQEYGPLLTDFDPAGNFTITAWIKGDLMDGPIISGKVHDDLFGLHIAGKTIDTDSQHLTIMGYGGTYQSTSFSPKYANASWDSLLDCPKDDWIFVAFTHTGGGSGRGETFIGSPSGIQYNSSPSTALLNLTDGGFSPSSALPSDFADNANMASIRHGTGASTIPGQAFSNGTVLIGGSLLRSLLIHQGLRTDGTSSSINIAKAVTTAFGSSAPGGDLAYGEDIAGSTAATTSSSAICADNMNISEVAVFNRVLTDAELATLYAARAEW